MSSEAMAITSTPSTSHAGPINAHGAIFAVPSIPIFNVLMSLFFFNQDINISTTEQDIRIT